MKIDELKKRLMGKEGVKKVIIRKDGSVETYGDMPRGDGGKKPWSRYEGSVSELSEMYDLGKKELGEK